LIPERSVEVLRAIVEDYIATREPVGSKALVERHGFDVSAATIRNDMALLEDELLIVAPHTSSGRVPTDKGYRLFVDRLSAVKPLSSAERQAIEGFLSGSADLDEVLGNSVRLLAQLTNQMAVVQYPTLGRAAVRSIELVPVTDTRVLLILVTDANRIQQHVLELGMVADLSYVAELRAKLNSLLVGIPLAQVSAKLSGFENLMAPGQRDFALEVVDEIDALVDANRSQKLLVSGTANLARRENDLGGNFTDVLEAIEEQVVLLKLINEFKSGESEVSVAIGSENQLDTFSTTTVVLGDYGNAAENMAKVGVIGPTRMDYSANIATVGAVARYLSKLLGN
jgi:heat-inducible transcriptional repressor